MLSPKKAKSIIKKCEKSEKFKPIRMYLFITLFSISIGVFEFLFPEKPPKATTILVIIFLTNIFLYFLYFFFNWYSKTLSLKNIIFHISNFNILPVKTFEDYLSSRSFSIHPYVFSHPVTLFFIGNILQITGNEQDGNDLINKAVQNYPELKGRHLESADIEYLLKLLREDKKFNKSYNAFQLWRVKSIRYAIIITGALIWIIYFLSQLNGWFNSD